MPRAVAIDLGATSGRFALGELKGDSIVFEVIEQIPHEPIETDGILRWDMDTLTGLCRRAVEFADANGAASVGIDSWGVDHGFIGHDGKLMASPVCYRDDSNTRAFERLAPYRQRLYELTGIQHQPFNTICQLAARKHEDPSLPHRCREWLILPDLLGSLLCGESFSELTQASTTQLMGLDGTWSGEAFQIAGWPVPERQPANPGVLSGKLTDRVSLAHVGSHDTASAVAGFGSLRPDQIFLNVGTWSLAGCVLESPLATEEAEQRMFTNERMVDGRVRFLKNIPGFYFINRLHKDLEIASSVPEWLAAATPFADGVDLLRSEFYNPPSMLQACRDLCRRPPETTEQWAGLALSSLAGAVTTTVMELHKLTGRNFTSIRVGGGGSQSEAFCRTLAETSGLKVLAGPSEVTVLGNLAAQFLAQGAFSSWEDAYRCVGSGS